VLQNRIPAALEVHSGPVNKRIGFGAPCFLVAEIGQNHQGDPATARELILTAARCGADAVKFQKRDVDALLTRAGQARPYTGPNSFGPTYGEHRRALELSLDQWAECKALAESLGLIFFATPWDPVSLDQLVRLGVGLLKICSADVVNLPLIRQAAALHLPLIISTGMSELAEIDAAVANATRFHEQIILLHCNSTYPCPPEEISLPVMELMRRRYGLPVGYSGHELGLGPSVAAAALGACVIERHFTLDRRLPGTDHQASLEPAEFASLVAMVRDVEKARLVCEKQVFAGERNAAAKLRKSLVAARDLPAGHRLGEEDFLTKSAGDPRDGISPLDLERIVGKKLLVAVRRDEMLAWNMLTG
jgi:sialic acid synthase